MASEPPRSKSGETYGETFTVRLTPTWRISGSSRSEVGSSLSAVAGLRTVLFLRNAIRHIPSRAASALGSASSIGAPMAAERPREDRRR